MINNLFKIKKISDLTQVCVLPVMILSIFLSFYLYIEMGKIRDKSQELVNNAIPHVLSAQQGAINLVHLKRNVETMTSSLDLQIARKAYVNTHILVSESVFAKSDYLQQKGSSLLQDVNHLWKLRLQLDDLRATVNSSLNHMDSLMYLIYNEQPMLFPELDSHVSNYTDIYKQSGNIRDLKGQHEFYYRLMLERLSEDFDQSSFLKEQIRIRKQKELEKASGINDDSNQFGQQFTSSSSVAYNASTLAGTVAGDQYVSDDVINQANSVFKRSIDAEKNAQNPQQEDTVSHNTSPRRSALQDREARSMPAVTGLFNDNPAPSNMSFEQRNNSVNNEFSVTARKNVNPELYEQIDDDTIELEIENIQERHSDPIFFKSREQDLKLLALYKSELDRFYTLWSLFTKLQTVFVYETGNLSNEIDALSHSFTSGETAILHGELSDISHLAAQIKPMVMLTVGFSLVSFWIVIFLLNRYIIKPLKNIACILIVFRRTKRVNLKKYEPFFAQEHVMEIREIIDVLPQLFDEFSTIEKKSTDLKLRYKQLLETSKYDGLTKVLNRGTLNLLVKTMGANTPANFAVLMVDIDHFKNLNDSMGHQRGDEVLFAVAQTLQSNLAKKDFVFRYGGEEFCVVLSDISPANAFKVAERLCNTIRNLALINNGVPSGLVTVSIGISLVTRSSNQFRVDELISQADKALYLAKRNGRDQVVACPKSMVFGMDDGGKFDLDNPNLAQEADPEHPAEIEKDTNVLAQDQVATQDSATALTVSGVLGFHEDEHDKDNHYEDYDKAHSSTEEDLLESKLQPVAQDGKNDSVATQIDTQVTPVHKKQDVTLNKVEAGKSTSEVILEAISGSVENTDKLDPAIQSLPQSYQGKSQADDKEDTDNKAEQEFNETVDDDVAYALAAQQYDENMSGSEAAKAKYLNYAEAKVVAPSMMSVDNFDHYATSNSAGQGQTSKSDVFVPKQDNESAEFIPEHASDKSNTQSTQNHSHTAQDIDINTKSAASDAENKAQDLLPSTNAVEKSTEPEQHEYELVLKADESGQIHEYFIGEQEGPIDLTEMAAKSGNRREKGKQSRSNSNKDYADDDEESDPAPSQPHVKNDSELDDLGQEDSKQVRQRKVPLLLGEVINIVKSRHKDNAQDGTSRRSSKPKEVIDQHLVAVMAAANPEQGITEDPFASERSMTEIAAYNNIPTLVDTDFFSPSGTIDENTFNPQEALIKHPNEQRYQELDSKDMVNARLKYEASGSPFFLKNDQAANISSQAETRHWSIASLFKRKLRSDKTQEEDSAVSKSDATQAALEETMDKQPDKFERNTQD